MILTDQIKKISKGLDVPIAGQPRQEIEASAMPTHVAVLGEDYVGMKPLMLVEVGDVVKKGQALFENTKVPGVVYTSPASGIVVEVNRGKRRVLQSVVIQSHTAEDAEQITFKSVDDIGLLSRAEIQANLIQSGLWTSLRTRPFSHVPQPESAPEGIFVTAMDTNPLAAEPRLVIDEQPEAFASGLQALTHLTDGKVYLCQDSGALLPGHDIDNVKVRKFSGVHPAGLVGTHIHFTLPVSLERQVWHIGYQDVIAIGQLFKSGKLYTDRIISLAGPFVSKPRLLRTQLGAKLSELVESELKPGFSRVVSGSVLSGHKAINSHDFLGRFHVQVTALEEDAQHQLMPWVQSGIGKFSMVRSITSGFKRSKKLFDFTTHTGGEARAVISFGQLDRVMPLDILPTLLVRDLVVKDTDEAQALGALELDEEDLALCTFVSPAKYDFGKELRTCLDIIEREG